MTTDCRQRWRAKCNHVRTGGLLTTPPPTTMIMPESNTTSFVFTTSVTTIARLNSGIRKRHNLFVWAFFVSKNGSDSMNHADTGDIKVLNRFPGNSISKFSTNFWKCVSGADMRGCFILKITQCGGLIPLVILTFKISGTGISLRIFWVL